MSMHPSLDGILPCGDGDPLAGAARRYAPSAAIGREGYACGHGAFMIDRDVVEAILRRPRLWGTAVSATLAFAPRGWWRRRPFLPVPDAEMMRWRIATAYGSSDATVDPADVVAYLEWRHRSAQG